MTCAAVHFGTHDHLVAPSESREAISEIHDAVKEQVSRTPKAKLSAIGMVVTRDVLLKELVDVNGASSLSFSCMPYLISGPSLGHPICGI